MEIKIKILKENAKLPTNGSGQAAGFDLYACADDYFEATIYPHETFKVGTGLAMGIPEGYYGAIYARSGLATKQGLRPANCVGVIDSDYRGEIVVALHNDSNDPQTYHNGDRIAQLIIQPCLDVEYKVVENLDETERGDGGFGHTGK